MCNLSYKKATTRRVEGEELVQSGLSLVFGSKKPKIGIFKGGVLMVRSAFHFFMKTYRTSCANEATLSVKIEGCPGLDLRTPHKSRKHTFYPLAVTIGYEPKRSTLSNGSFQEKKK